MTKTDLLQDYVDRQTLAGELGVTERTVWRYENQPDGLPNLMIGGRKLYRRSSVQAWLDAREDKPPK